MELRSELTGFWGQEKRWLWDMDTSTMTMFTKRQGWVHKLTNFLEVPMFALFLRFSVLFSCRHSRCAETCIFASSPLYCIMNAPLRHTWKHMWQDGLFSSRCARFLSTCRGLRMGGGERTRRGRVVRQYRRAKKRRMKLKQSFVTISRKLNTFTGENN